MHALQSAVPLQTPNEGGVDAFEFMDPAIETTSTRELLTTEDINAATAVSVDSVITSLCRCILPASQWALRGQSQNVNDRVHACITVQCYQLSVQGSCTQRI